MTSYTTLIGSGTVKVIVCGLLFLSIHTKIIIAKVILTACLIFFHSLTSERIWMDVRIDHALDKDTIYPDNSLQCDNFQQHRMK